MEFIDTHTHVNLRAFNEDAGQAIQRAFDAGVGVVNVGTQIDTSRQAVALLEKFPENIYAVVGLHPSHTFAHNFEDGDEIKFKTREEHFDSALYRELATDERVVGIGECGLDYYRLPEDRDHEEIKTLQRAAFREQINLALELDKALCVHCRPSGETLDAYLEMLEIIAEVKSANPNLRFEIHCYTGDAETALKFVELGGFIGLNGIITFDKTGRSESVVKALPLNAIVLETDAPYLTPKSHRGQRNEPSYLPEVAQQIAGWKSVNIEEVAEATTANAKKLFNI
ncbi:MAG TPA: TatD family hydrolase [Patescibacteria group bacterium]|jgi:TatD DNase family protein|nr:TatD family hydrolase [Patescibacteria group bacterium]